MDRRHDMASATGAPYDRLSPQHEHSSAGQQPSSPAPAARGADAQPDLLDSIASVPRLRGKLHIPRAARAKREWATPPRRYRVRAGWHYARVSDNLVDLLRLIDGARSIAEIAAAMSQRQHRHVHPAEVAYLLRKRLLPARLITIRSVPGASPSSVRFTRTDLAPATPRLPSGPSMPELPAPGAALDELTTQPIPPVPTMQPAPDAAAFGQSASLLAAALSETASPAGPTALSLTGAPTGVPAIGPADALSGGLAAEVPSATPAEPLARPHAALPIEEQTTAAVTLPAAQVPTSASELSAMAPDKQPTAIVAGPANVPLTASPAASPAHASVAPVVVDGAGIAAPSRLIAAPPSGPQSRRAHMAAHASALPARLSGVLAAPTVPPRARAARRPYQPTRITLTRPQAIRIGTIGALLLGIALLLVVSAGPIGNELARRVSPSRTPHPTATPALPQETILPGETAYTVQKGDTLDGIAQRYAVNTAALLAVNADILPTAAALTPGMRLAVPAKYRAGVPAQNQPRPLYYIVRPGDTLSGIGDRFGVDWDTIVSYNKLKNPNALTPGQSIVIPPASD